MDFSATQKAANFNMCAFHWADYPCSFHFFTEIQLTYTVVVICALQQSDSVIHLCISFFIFCSLVVFYYGLSEDTECRSLCSTVGPVVYSSYTLACICYSQTPSPALLILPSHRQPQVYFVYVCESISVLQISLYVSCFRFHM